MVIKRYKIAGVQAIKILITTSAAQFNREDAGITQQWYQSPLYLFFRFLDMWFLRYMHDYCVNYVCIEF